MSAPTVTVAAQRGTPPLLMPAVAIFVVLAIHWETVAGLVHIWITDTTFGHCFAIPPLSAWLLWRRRDALQSIRPEFSWLGAALLLALNGLWAVSELTGVSVTQHFAIVAMIPAVLWTVMGTAWMRRAVFPLAFLMFAVPFGDAFVPMLRTVTADTTVFLLRLTGVPVLQDRLYFSIPSGNFEVIKACSGIRYLIATLAISVLFAHLSYRSWRRIFLFMTLAVILPIIGNGLRAYMIVMIAHLSNMKYAVGIDHFIYGWVMFALMVGLLFWIGSRFRENESAMDVANAVAPGAQPSTVAPSWHGLLIAGAAAVIGLVSPNMIRALANRSIDQYSDGTSVVEEVGALGVAGNLPKSQSSWIGPTAVTSDPASVYGEPMTAERRWIGQYSQANAKVTAQVFFYLRPSSEKSRLTRSVEELHTSSVGVDLPVSLWTHPSITPKHPMLSWRTADSSYDAIHFGWYLNPSGALTSATVGKIYQAQSWLRLCPSAEAFVLISAPVIEGDEANAERTATSFMAQHAVQIETAALDLLRGNSGCGQ